MMDIKDNFKLITLINFPNALTLLNLGAGITSILFAASNEFFIASIFMLIAVFFDMIDGRIARFMNKETNMGKALDSICDMVSFGVAPVVLAFQTTKNIGEGGIFAAIIYVIFLAAGALRLARFNIKELKYFEGMAITLNGLIIPVFYFLGLNSWYPFVLLVSAVLMVSAFRIKKFI